MTGLEAILNDLREWREEAWRKYMEHAGDSHIEALRQGKFEGIDRCMKRVVREIAKEAQDDA